MTFVLAREKGQSKRNLSLFRDRCEKEKKKRIHISRLDIWREKPSVRVWFSWVKIKTINLLALLEFKVVFNYTSVLDLIWYSLVLFHSVSFFRIYSGEPQIHTYNCTGHFISTIFLHPPFLPDNNVFYWRKKEIGYFLCLSCALIDFQRRIYIEKRNSILFIVS